MKSSNVMRSLKLVLFTLSLISLMISPAVVFAKTYQLTILHTNDQHGHFFKFNPYPVQDVGGMAAQSALVNVVRAEVEKDGGYTLLLSAGDVCTGVPESDMLDAEPDFKLMNLLGYDAMVLGNHEFDKPLEVLMKQRQWAKFPFISANVMKRDTGECLVDPYIIKNFNGLKVAVLGLTTEETPILVVADNVKTLEFKSPIEVAKDLVPKLRAEADVVVALTHLGFYEESGSRYKAPGDFKLAREVNGIDIIIGGHSHTAVEKPKVINDTLILQAGEWSKYVGRLDLTFDSDSDKITGYKYQLMPVNMKKRVKYKGGRYYVYVDKGYVEDKKILDAMKPYMAKADTLLSQTVGKAIVKLVGDRKIIRSQETNLANLVTDGMRAKTKADIAFQNAGGIRTDIAPGTITYRDILKVMPFGNTLVIMDMTGKQIMEVLAYAATVKPGHGAFLQVSGMKWTNNKGKPENVMVGDTPLELERIYKVVTNSFMAGGGDGYAMFKGIQKMDTGFVDADSLREYIVVLGEVNAKVEGRLTLIQ